MTTDDSKKNFRVLVVDDNRAIHDDFRKVLGGSHRTSKTLAAAAAELFGDEPAVAATPEFELDSAYQGQEGLERVTQAKAAQRPYAVAFVDVRMPPGWDGIETTERIWQVDPDLQIVICTAYSDYSWDDMMNRLGHSDRLLILKKPFDNIEALQLATALSEKWHLLQETRRHVEQLEEIVAHRTDELRKSEERYRLITENASELIGITNADGQLLYRSPTFERLLGYTAQDLAGRGALDIVHPEERDAVKVATLSCITEGVSRVCEFRVQRKDGSWLTVESHYGPFRNAAGVVEGALFVARDVTERRKLEVQLRQAQKLESIGQLAAGIAHEINTPTQFIGDNTRFIAEAFTQLRMLLDAYTRLRAAAETGAIPPDVLGAVRTAEHNADPAYLFSEIPRAISQTLEGVERTTRIVQAMKVFSHPGTVQKTPLNLNLAVESTLTICRNEWRYIADVVTDLDPLLPAVPGIAGELNQVLLNLIINATHAIADVVGNSGQDKGRITISTRHDGDWVEVRVSDTGTGIPERVRNRIFDPFFTTKPVGKGTGQGLAIARSVVVERHGGTLNFETEMGRGSVFIIRLPLQPEVAARHAVPAAGRAA